MDINNDNKRQRKEKGGVRVRRREKGQRKRGEKERLKRGKRGGKD